MPKVFIIILNYNGKKVLRNCLSSVFNVDYSNFSVVVVDNDSTDGSLEEAKLYFPRVNFIKNEANLGFSAGNNAGIKFALERMADYVLLLNNDTVVSKDFLKKLVEAAESDDKIGIASPLILKKDKNQIWFSSGEINWLRMKTNHREERAGMDIYKSEFVSGCAMLIKAKVFKKVGLFDEDYFLYWEDADFSYRAGKAGFSVVVAPQSEICHLEQSETTNKNKIYWLVLSGLIFFKKNSPWFFRPWIYFFVKLRRIKNWLDRRKKVGELPEAVHKAYKNFQNAGI